jgi:hypothetical protein
MAARWISPHGGQMDFAAWRPNGFRRMAARWISPHGGQMDFAAWRPDGFRRMAAQGSRRVAA